MLAIQIILRPSQPLGRIRKQASPCVNPLQRFFRSIHPSGPAQSAVVSAEWLVSISKRPYQTRHSRSPMVPSSRSKVSVAMSSSVILLEIARNEVSIPSVPLKIYQKMSKSGYIMVIVGLKILRLRHWRNFGSLVVGMELKVFLTGWSPRLIRCTFGFSSPVIVLTRLVVTAAASGYSPNLCASR